MIKKKATISSFIDLYSLINLSFRVADRCTSYEYKSGFILTPISPMSGKESR